MNKPQSITAYPLCWPTGRPRTSAENRKVGKFKTSFSLARDQAIAEIRRLGGSDAIVSTSIPLKKNGLPEGVAWGKQLAGDNGVAVYFKRKGKELCFACDCWVHVQDNMHAICLTIEALRGIARWGTGDMMEAAFRGFAALPAPGEAGGDKPWEILGVSINASPDQIKEAYRGLVKKFHTDNLETGDKEKFIQIQRAYEMMGQA